MSRFAYFDHTANPPCPVIQWYDTIAFSYSSLPDEADLFPLTDEEWNNHLITDSFWAIDNGVLVPFDLLVPPPSQQQLAAVALAEKILDGIGVASVSTPSINATYALDQISTAQIFQIGMYANQFAFFPSGGTTQMYPDILGIPHAFSVPLFIAFLQAVAPLVSDMNTQAGIMASGGTPVWPTQAATII
jgi:hypothetical protein